MNGFTSGSRIYFKASILDKLTIENSLLNQLPVIKCHLIYFPGCKFKTLNI